MRARTTATLASRITAPVVSVHVTAGDRVRSGQPLVTLDARDLDANRSRAASEAVALERAHAAALADRAAAEAALALARTSHARVAVVAGARSSDGAGTRRGGRGPSGRRGAAAALPMPRPPLLPRRLTQRARRKHSPAPPPPYADPDGALRRRRHRASGRSRYARDARRSTAAYRRSASVPPRGRCR